MGFLALGRILKKISFQYFLVYPKMWALYGGGANFPNQINKTLYQHINTSTHQHINTSTHQHTTYQHIQHINTSTHQHMKCRRKKMPRGWIFGFLIEFCLERKISEKIFSSQKVDFSHVFRWRIDKNSKGVVLVKYAKSMKKLVFSAKSAFCQNSNYATIIHHISLRYMGWEPTEPFWAQRFFTFFHFFSLLPFKPQSAVFNRDLQIQKVSRKSGINRKLNTGRLRSWSCASNASSTTQNGLTTTEKNPILCDLPNSYSISTKKGPKRVVFFVKNAQKCSKNHLTFRSFPGS